MYILILSLSCFSVIENNFFRLAIDTLILKPPPPKKKKASYDPTQNHRFLQLKAISEII